MKKLYALLITVSLFSIFATSAFATATIRNATLKNCTLGVGAAPPGPTPPLTGLLSWYKGDGDKWTTAAESVLATADGDPIGSWKDYGSFGINAKQSNGAKLAELEVPGINGIPAIRFNGTTAALQATLAGLSAQAEISVFAVVQFPTAPTATNSFGATFTGGSNSTFAFFTGSPQTIYSNNGGYTVDIFQNGVGPQLRGTPVRPNVTYIIGFTRTGTTGAWNLTLRRNGIIDHAGTTASNPTYSTDFGLGQIGGVSSFFSNSLISEFLIYDHNTVGAELTAIEDYLNTRSAPAMFRAPRLFCDGNSITAGYTIAQSDAYPAQLQTLYGNGLEILNVGLINQTTADMHTRFAASIAPLLAVPNSFYIAMEGTNDMTPAAGNLTPAQAYSGLTTIIADAHAVTGTKVGVMTMPYTDRVAFNLIADYNALVIANSGGADAVEDLAADSRMQNPANTTYFSDGTHPTVAGAGVIASHAKTLATALVAGTSGAFNPGGIASLELWLENSPGYIFSDDAMTTLAVSGNTVGAKRTRKSGLPSRIQATGGSRPAFDTHGTRYVDNKILTGTAVTLTGAFTVYSTGWNPRAYDVLHTLGVSQYYPASKASSQTLIGVLNGKPVFENDAAGLVGNSVSITNRQFGPYVMRWRRDASNNVYFHCTGQNDTGEQNIGTLSGTFTIDSEGEGFGQPGTNFPLNDVLIFSTDTVTAGTDTNIQSYLRTRFPHWYTFANFSSVFGATGTFRNWVVEGDSISSGFNTEHAESGWQIQTISHLTHGFRQTTLSAGGRQMSSILSEDTTGGAFDSAYPATMGANDIITLWAGTNDSDKVQAFSDIQSWVTACRAKFTNNPYIFIFTCLPRSDVASGPQEAARLTFNTNIRNQSWGAKIIVVDIGGDANMGQTGQDTNTLYYDDGIHPTEYGHTYIMENYVIPALLAVGA